MANQQTENLKPLQVLELLIEGNARFTGGLRSIDTFLSTTKLKTFAEEGQKPFCTLLTCSDSRLPVEFIFDQGLGDFFVIRSLGSVVDDYVVASIEYSVAQFGISLVVVMGHSRSGAVRMSMESDIQGTLPSSPNMTALLEQIRPSFEKAKKQIMKGRTLVSRNENLRAWEEILERTYLFNLQRSVDQVLKKSPFLSEKVKEKKLFFVTASYNLKTGQMEFVFPKGLCKLVACKKMKFTSLDPRKVSNQILKNSLRKSKAFHDSK